MPMRTRLSGATISNGSPGSGPGGRLGGASSRCREQRPRALPGGRPGRTPRGGPAWLGFEESLSVLSWSNRRNGLRPWRSRQGDEGRGKGMGRRGDGHASTDLEPGHAAAHLGDSRHVELPGFGHGEAQRRWRPASGHRLVALDQQSSWICSTRLAPAAAWSRSAHGALMRSAALAPGWCCWRAMRSPCRRSLRFRLVSWGLPAAAPWSGGSRRRASSITPAM